MAQKMTLGKGLASLLPPLAEKPKAAEAKAADKARPAPEPSSAHPSPGGEPASGATVAGPAFTPFAESTNKDRHLGISMAALSEIRANPYQPRREFDETALRELSQSILASGIIQPLVVRKAEGGGFELIAGERRLRASKLAGLTHVPVVIRKSTDREALELALVENIQRQNLNCVDEAHAYFQLMEDFGFKQEEVAERAGKDRATVANYLRILRLPEIILDDLKRQLLTFGHGKALLSLETAEQRIHARKLVLEGRLSVRETEALIETMKETPAGRPLGAAPQKSPMAQRLLLIARDLGRRWSTRVQIKGNEGKGKIVVHYASREDLDRLLETLGNHR